MRKSPQILAIIGSTREQSSNLHLVQWIAAHYKDDCIVEIYDSLDELPHFNPDLDNEHVSSKVALLRNKITNADGVLICTPEYVFSLPGSLKNMLEWMVSTTVFSDKPTALITASGLGEKAHESLQLIMRTLGVRTNDQLQLWINGVRSKISEEGVIKDEEVIQKIQNLMNEFTKMLNK